jgi:hypothetical protein
MSLGLEVARTIVLKMAIALNQPKPSFPTAKDMRTMMYQLWRNHKIDEINEGKCGPTMQRCLNDVITELEDMSEREMQEQIMIRMTKTTQDSPPHSTQNNPAHADRAHNVRQIRPTR